MPHYFNFRMEQNNKILLLSSKERLKIDQKNEKLSAVVFNVAQALPYPKTNPFSNDTA